MADNYPNENDDYSDDDYDSSVYTSESENIEIEDDYMFDEDEEEEMIDEMAIDTKSSQVDRKDLPKINTAIPEINPWTKKLNNVSSVPEETNLVSLEEIMKQQVKEEAILKQKKKEAEKQKQIKEVKSKFMLLSQKNNPNYNKNLKNQNKPVIRCRKPRLQQEK